MGTNYDMFLILARYSISQAQTGYGPREMLYKHEWFAHKFLRCNSLLV